MNRKLHYGLIIFLALVVISVCAVSFAAEKKAPAAPAKMGTPANIPAPVKPNFGMLAGTVVSIDTKDPANVKIEIKNDADGTTHTVTVTQWTNITKVTDVSEIKPGESIRMMTRKVDDKDVAMGIMFGKMKVAPPPMPAAPAKAPAKK